MPIPKTTPFFFALCFWLPSAIVTAAIGDNIALTSNGGSASQSSYYRSGWPASKCTDNVTSSWSSSNLCHTSGNSSSNEWWDLELTDSKSIDSIVVYNRTQCCTNRILNIYVLISDSPFPAGADAASLSAARAQANFEYQITVEQAVTTITVNNLYGQYVRLQKAGGALNVGSNSINLVEVQVFEGGGIVDLQVNKSVNNTSPDIGETITFELAVSNLGPDDAVDVSVVDTPPDGFGEIANISDAGVLDAAGTINWTIPSLPMGDVRLLTFDARVFAP